MGSLWMYGKIMNRHVSAEETLKWIMKTISQQQTESQQHLISICHLQGQEWTYVKPDCVPKTERRGRGGNAFKNIYSMRDCDCVCVFSIVCRLPSHTDCRWVFKSALPAPRGSSVCAGERLLQSRNQQMKKRPFRPLICDVTVMYAEAPQRLNQGARATWVWQWSYRRWFSYKMWARHAVLL